MYSDNISNPINIGTNIAIERPMYLKLENTSLIVCHLNHWNQNLFKVENGCAPLINCCCPSEPTIKNPGVLLHSIFSCLLNIVLNTFRIFSRVKTTFKQFHI